MKRMDKKIDGHKKIAAYCFEQILDATALKTVAV